MSSSATTSPVPAMIRAAVALSFAALALGMGATAAVAAPGLATVTPSCSLYGDSGASWSRLNPDRVKLMWVYGPGEGEPLFAEATVTARQRSYYVPTPFHGIGVPPYRMAVTLYRGSKTLRYTDTPCVA